MDPPRAHERRNHTLTTRRSFAAVATQVVQGMKQMEGAGVQICRTIGTPMLRNLGEHPCWHVRGTAYTAQRSADLCFNLLSPLPRGRRPLPDAGRAAPARQGRRCGLPRPPAPRL